MKDGTRAPLKGSTYEIISHYNDRLDEHDDGYRIDPEMVTNADIRKEYFEMISRIRSRKEELNYVYPPYFRILGKILVVVIFLILGTAAMLLLGLMVLDYLVQTSVVPPILT